MKRISVFVLIVAVAVVDAFGFRSATPASDGAVAPLPIPNRRQWDCNFLGQSCCGPCRGVEAVLAAFQAAGQACKSELQNGNWSCANVSPACNQCISAHNGQPTHTCVVCEDPSFPDCDPLPICDGYCGEQSIQETALYYGAYVSQGMIRKIQKDDDHEILFLKPFDAFFDEYRINRSLTEDQVPNMDVRYPSSSDIGSTVQKLGLGHAEWTGLKGPKQFLTWARDQLSRGNPIILGVTAADDPALQAHIVTAVGTTGEGHSNFSDAVIINDHFGKVRYLPLDQAVDPCEGQANCLPTNGVAEAILPPPSVAEASLLRLSVINAPLSSDYTPGSNTPMPGEPNWSAGSEETFELSASLAHPGLLDPDKQWFVAATYAATPADIRDATESPFSWPPASCYAMDSAAREGAPISVGAVPSRGAAFFRVVSEGCPAV